MAGQYRAGARYNRCLDHSVGRGPFICIMVLRFAHISDLHLPPLPWVRPGEILNKRLLGFLSWHKKRKFRHRAEVITALEQDLAAQQPDHICITGDITNIGLPREFSAARTWLERLAPPDTISLVPGNHDAYIGSSLHAMREELSSWLPDRYPSLWRRNEVAIIGVSTAVATAPGLATGKVGDEQRDALAELLQQGARAGWYRIVLLHHPVGDGHVSARKRLTDAAAVRKVLQDCGAELVLHGHGHCPVHYGLPSAAGTIPVYGAGSASLYHDGHLGHYHFFTLNGRELSVAHRYYDPQHASFMTGQDVPLSTA